MLIQNFQAFHENGQFRIQADVTLEKRDVHETIFFSVPDRHADWIHLEPNAFMVGLAMAGIWNGESRMNIAAAVDPQLGSRLTMAMRLMTHWHKSPLRPLELLAPSVAHPMPGPAQSATAIFLSGGVDALAALHWNTQHYEIGDPRRISVAFFVYGLDIGWKRPDVWELGVEKLTGLCQKLGIELVPIQTNLRNLSWDWHFYGEWQFASLLAAIAHTASTRINRCIIAPDNALENIQHPHGSHPWLNSYYGADFLQILTGDMEQFNRLEKVRMLSAWPESLDVLRVCWVTNAIPEGYLNCGRCPKCIRTMLELLVCGKLAHTTVFPVKDVTPEMLGPLRITSYFEVEYFGELVEPLMEMGRRELADKIKWKLRMFHAEQRFGVKHLRPIVKRILGKR